MADKPAEGDYFDFFGLPRELRDYIYDDILRRETGPANVIPDGLRVKIRFTPVTSHLLLSKQFTEELQHHSGGITELLVEDELDTLGQYSLPGDVQHHTRVHVNLYALCILEGCGPERCGTLIELREHRKMVVDILGQMPAVQRCTIDLYLEDDIHIPACMQAVRDNLGMFTIMDVVVEVRVYSINFQYKYIGWIPERDYAKRKDLLLEWKRDGSGGEKA